MSTQTADSPDFFQGQQWQNPVPLVYESNVSNPPTKSYGPFNVIHWEGLLINTQSSATLSGTATWFADMAQTMPVGTQTFQCALGIPYIDIWPVVAPFVRLDITYGPGPGPYTTSLIVLPVLGGDPWKRPLLDLNVFATGTANQAPGVTTKLPQLVTTGKAHFGVWTDATSWSFTLMPTTGVFGVAGALAALGNIAPAVLNYTAAVSLPAQPVNLNINNGDAVNRNFRWSLVIER